MTTQAKYLIIAAVVMLVLAGGAFIYLMPATAPGPDVDITGGNPPAATGTPNVPPTTTPTSTAPSSAPATMPPTPSGIAMVQVAAHSGSAGCWTVIRGNVYDLTGWISKHPGGQQAILKICGKDGTDTFVGKHGGSQKQEDILATFKIGVLAK